MIKSVHFERICMEKLHLLQKFVAFLIKTWESFHKIIGMLKKLALSSRTQQLISELLSTTDEFLCTDLEQGVIVKYHHCIYTVSSVGRLCPSHFIMHH